MYFTLFNQSGLQTAGILLLKIVKNIGIIAKRVFTVESIEMSVILNPIVCKVLINFFIPVIGHILNKYKIIVIKILFWEFRDMLSISMLYRFRSVAASLKRMTMSFCYFDTSV